MVNKPRRVPRKEYQRKLLKEYDFIANILKFLNYIQRFLTFKLQEKSAVLTQIRKQRGKKLPEELAKIEDIKAYQCTGSHTVCF